MGPRAALPSRFNFAQHLLRRIAVAPTGSRTSTTPDAHLRRSRGRRRADGAALARWDSAARSACSSPARHHRLPARVPRCAVRGRRSRAANTLLTADDYAYMLEHCRAQALVVSGALLPRSRRRWRARRTRCGTSSCRGPAAARPRAARSPRVAAQPAAAPAAAATRADDIAFWLYSSGSTGEPEGHRAHARHLCAPRSSTARGVLGLREDDVVFSAAKLFFAYGLGNALTFPLSSATTVLMAERPTPRRCSRGSPKRKPTVFFGVPTLYAAMLASPELPARRGAPAPLRLGGRGAAQGDRRALRARASGARSSTASAGPRCCTSSCPTGRATCATARRGTPVPGYDSSCASTTGQTVVDGEIGDALRPRPERGARVLGEARRNRRATFPGEWTQRGDKYRRDPDGSYTYAGRSDDMLKVSGQYVSPVEVESALAAHEAVVEAAVVGDTGRRGADQAARLRRARSPGAAERRARARRCRTS